MDGRPAREEKTGSQSHSAAYHGEHSEHTRRRPRLHLRRGDMLGNICCPETLEEQDVVSALQVCGGGRAGCCAVFPSPRRLLSAHQRRDIGRGMRGSGASLAPCRAHPISGRRTALAVLRSSEAEVSDSGAAAPVQLSVGLARMASRISTYALRDSLRPWGLDEAS